MKATSAAFGLTYTGKQIVPTAIDPGAISLADIAHALAYTCRFAGHAREFYSVARHSLHVAALLPRSLKPLGLMHDAHEAYVCDVPAWLKPAIPGYDELEARWAHAVRERFGLLSNHSEEDWAQVHAADMQARATELRDLMVAGAALKGLPAPDPLPVNSNLEPWADETAFLRAASALGVR